MDRQELKNLIIECLVEYKVAQKGSAKPKAEIPENELINQVWNEYPSRCPVGKRAINRTHRKCNSKIAKAIKKYGFANIIGYQLWYIEDCTETNTFIKGYEAFLNQLPEKEELEVKAEIALKKKFVDSEGYFFDGFDWTDAQGCFLTKKEIQDRYNKWVTENF